MRLSIAARLAIVALVAALGGCGGALFACENADECAGAGAGARCESDGWCSVDDDACPSGRRYGEHSGDGKGGACVEDSGTSSTGATMSTTTLDPSTVTSLDPTTLDPTTWSTSMDPSMATLESTSASDSDATSSSGMTTLDPTTEGPQPSCGNAIVEADEDCDGDAPSVECEDLGWFMGEVACVDCSYDTSECEGCGPDGCSFEPCVQDSPRGCPEGESCANLVDGGMCTGSCTVDEHCSHPRFDTVCYMSQQPMGICLVSCEDGPCPVGMDCVPVTPPVCVFT